MLSSSHITQRKIKVRLLACLVALAACQPVSNLIPDYIRSDQVPPIDKTREAKMLSAFFGLDNAMTPNARLIWKGAPGKDGLPIVFSHEIDPESLQASDFQLKTQQGEILGVEHVSYKPAVEEFELRTLLLIGEFGNAPDNEPIEVEIVEELKSRDGQDLKGQKIAVTPLEEGPFLSYAEYFRFDDAYPYVEEGRGCDCPKQGTEQVVRIVWSGGVRSVEGEEIGEAELSHIHVKLLQGQDTVEVKPFQIADLQDNENNIDLCLQEKGTPIAVKVDANIAIDPNDDPNPETEVEVLSRW